MAAEFAVPILLLAAACFLIGARAVGQQLVGVAVAIGVLLPVAIGVLGSMSIASTAVIGGAGVLLIVTIVAAYVRFHDRRQRLAKFTGEKPASLKRRVDRI